MVRRDAGGRDRPGRERCTGGAAGFTLPGDISASGRFYARDITPPIELAGDFIEVPRGVEFRVEPIAEVPDEVTRSVEWAGA